MPNHMPDGEALIVYSSLKIVAYDTEKAVACIHITANTILFKGCSPHLHCEVNGVWSRDTCDVDEFWALRNPSMVLFDQIPSYTIVNSQERVKLN